MEQKDKQYRVGIIGLGRVAWELENDPLRPKPCTHMGAWLSQNNIKVTAACDINPLQNEKFGKKYNIAATYTNYIDMLNQENLDFVSICAYATERFAMVKSALEVGVKGIWCEKAVATSLQEAQKLKELLDHYPSKMIVSYMRRWENCYLCVANMIENGTIGRLQSINAHFSGNMLHTGTHAIDVMRMFAGEVRQVQAWLIEPDKIQAQTFERGGALSGDDYGGYAILHFDNNAIGFIHGEDREYFRFELELLGSKGMIRLGNTQTELWQIAESSYSQGLSELKQQIFPEYAPSNIWMNACAELVSSVVGNTPVTSGIDDAYNNLAIALAMHDSHLNNHSPVSMKNAKIFAVVKNR